MGHQLILRNSYCYKTTNSRNWTEQLRTESQNISMISFRKVRGENTISSLVLLYTPPFAEGTLQYERTRVLNGRLALSCQSLRRPATRPPSHASRRGMDRATGLLASCPSFSTAVVLLANTFHCHIPLNANYCTVPFVHARRKVHTRKLASVLKHVMTPKPILAL